MSLFISQGHVHGSRFPGRFRGREPSIAHRIGWCPPTSESSRPMPRPGFYFFQKGMRNFYNFLFRESYSEIIWEWSVNKKRNRMKRGPLRKWLYKFNIKWNISYVLLRNKWPQDTVAWNNKHLLSHKFPWIRKSGAALAEWFWPTIPWGTCSRDVHRAQSQLKPSLGLEDPLPRWRPLTAPSHSS